MAGNKPLWAVWLMVVAIFTASPASGQLVQPSNSLTSNYAERGFDIEYQGNGIPQEATLDGRVTRLDDLSDTIRTNRTTASLSCASRAMEVDLEFAEPFYGIVYADFSRQSACSFVGKGGTKYHYELPLSGCGTIQDPLRVFTNNILVRFHPSLELEGDEVKTIVCRYPEPIVPPPAAFPERIQVPPVPVVPVVPERLAEPQILLMICALLFLAMMLLGVACSYFCLKQRNIKLIRRRRELSSGPGSEVTGYSEQTIFVPPFEGLKIPRVHTPPERSDTLPSDYPSESRSGSEMEELEVREQELSSVHSDLHAQVDVDTFGLPTVIPRVDPTFDVAFRVKHPKRKSPAPPSVTSDDTAVSVLVAQERALTTILEKEEWRQTEAARMDSAKPRASPPLDGPADIEPCPPPGYAQVLRKPRDPSPARSLESNPRSVGEMVLKPFVKAKAKSPEATFRVTTEIPEKHLTERTLVLNEDIQLHRTNFQEVREDEETETMIVPTQERPVPPPKLQEADDVYLKTITETRVVDEEERIRRQTTEYHQRPKPNWDVAIKSHPPPQEHRTPSETTVSTMPPIDWNVTVRQYPPVYEPRTPSESTVWSQAAPPDWDVTIRQYPPVYEPRTPSESTVWDVQSQGPPPDWDVTIRQYPPIYEPRTPSESTVWDAQSQVTEPPPQQPPPDFDVKIRQYPPVYPSRSPSQSTNWDETMSQVTSVAPPPPDWDVKVRQYPPVYPTRSPSQSTNWDDVESTTTAPPPPDWDVKVRQYPPVYEPRSPSESTVWDDRRSTSTAPPPPPEWDVKVRQYPPVYEPRSPSESTVWDDRRSTSTAPPPPPEWDVKVRQYPPVYEPRSPSESTVWDDRRSTSTAPPPAPEPEWKVNIRQYPPVHPARTLSESTDQSADPSEPTEPRPVNWDVLIRVLNPPPGPVSEPDDDDASSVLTVEDRQRWHQIITTESTLRTMLTECVVREDYERIRRDTRFQRIFEPKKWDVIIRVLSAPPPPTPRDESSTSDTRSETTGVNSEPGDVPLVRPAPPRRPPRSSDTRPPHGRLTTVRESEHYVVSSSSYHFEARYGEPDTWSDSSENTSAYPRSTADRSMHSEMVERPPRIYRPDWEGQSDDGTSRPSLVRSTSEYTEEWPQRLPYDRVSNGSENYSHSGSSGRRGRRPRPVLERSSTEVMEEVPQAEAAADDRSSSTGSDSSRDFNRRVPYERVPSSSGSEGSPRRPE